MFKKNYFKILFICLVLVKICFAKPTNNEAQEQTNPPNGLCDSKTTLAKLSAENVNQKPPSLQLLNFTASGMMGYLLTIIEKAKQKSDQILNDQELLQIANNDEVKTFIQNLQHFQEEYKNCRSFKKIGDIYGSFLYTCGEYYEEEELGLLSSDGTVILKVLKKYDILEMINDLEIDANKFVEKFVEKYENLKESINKENNKIGERISHWYEEFQTIKDYAKKINALNQLAELYKQEFLENKTTS